jgi:hypothetical protein
MLSRWFHQKRAGIFKVTASKISEPYPARAPLPPFQI